MADEQKQPENEQPDVETVQVDADVDSEAPVTPEYEPEQEDTEALPDETPLQDSVKDVYEATSEAEDAAPVQAWDEAVSGAMEAAESVVEADGHAHSYSDEVVVPFFGYVGTMTGGIYTFVFLVLGALTLIEVLITVLFPENVITITLLVTLSLLKAYLVVYYYMHLKQDNPLFAVAILLPLVVVALSVLYLIFVPTGPGLGYS